MQGKPTLIEELRDIWPRDSGYADVGRRAAARLEAYEAALREAEEGLAVGSLKAAFNERRMLSWISENEGNAYMAMAQIFNALNRARKALGDTP